MPLDLGELRPDQAELAMEDLDVGPQMPAWAILTLIWSGCVTDSGTSSSSTTLMAF
jgi:hypothetical protein